MSKHLEKQCKNGEGLFTHGNPDYISNGDASCSSDNSRASGTSIVFIGAPLGRSGLSHALQNQRGVSNFWIKSRYLIPNINFLYIFLRIWILVFINFWCLATGWWWAVGYDVCESWFRFIPPGYAFGEGSGQGMGTNPSLSFTSSQLINLFWICHIFSDFLEFHYGIMVE